MEDARTARGHFRERRLSEPSVYASYYKSFVAAFREIIPKVASIHSGEVDLQWLVKVAGTERGLDCLRYLTAPPISHDDLETLSDVSVSASVFGKDATKADVAMKVIAQLLDPCRFPWVFEERAPSKQEIEIAVASSAALLASQRVETDRRNKAKDEQEAAVKQVFLDLGFKEVPAKAINVMADAPPAGCFCGQTKLNNKQGDVFARLKGDRLLAIECKVSNSEVNSFKRVKGDAESKVTEWREAVGKNHLIAVTVLRGVFKPDNLLTAQERMFLVWDHRIEDLRDFVSAVQKG